MLRVDINATARYLLKLLALTAVYYLSARIGLLIQPFGYHVSAIWPPAGIMVVALFSWGANLWPAIVLGELALNVFSATPLYGTLGFAFSNTIHATLSVYLLRIVVQFQPSLKNVRDAVGLILASALVASAVSSSIGMIFRYVLQGGMPLDRIIRGLSTWWVADAVSVIAISPLLFSVVAGLKFPPARQRIRPLEILIAWSLLGIVLLLVLFGPIRQPALVFPVIVWLALRSGIRETSLGVFLTSTAFSLDAMNPGGVFAQGAQSVDLVSLNVTIGLVAVTGVVLAAVSAERDQYEMELVQANTTLEEKVQERTQSLQHALDNVKTLSGLLPICSHCKKIRNDKGYWQAVEGYVSDHSQAEFTHGICPDCMQIHFPDVIKRQQQSKDNEDHAHYPGRQ